MGVGPMASDKAIQMHFCSRGRFCGQIQKWKYEKSEGTKGRPEPQAAKSRGTPFCSLVVRKC